MNVGLNQMLILTVLLEEHVDDIASLMTLPHSVQSYADQLMPLLRCISLGNLIKIDAGILLDSINHSKTLANGLPRSIGVSMYKKSM